MKNAAVVLGLQNATIKVETTVREKQINIQFT